MGFPAGPGLSGLVRLATFERRLRNDPLELLDARKGRRQLGVDDCIFRLSVHRFSKATYSGFPADRKHIDHPHDLTPRHEREGRWRARRPAKGVSGIGVSTREAITLSGESPQFFRRVCTSGRLHWNRDPDDTLSSGSRAIRRNTDSRPATDYGCVPPCPWRAAQREIRNIRR